MRGFGELRQVNKVRLHLSGSGNVDFSVAVAVNFVNDDHTLPVLYECDRYEGPISDGEIVEISCLEDNAEEPDYGYGRHGYALYAQFVTGATGATGVMQQLAICRMDIVLRDRGDKLREEMTHSVTVFSAILSSFFVLAAGFVIIWYIIATRKMDEDSNFVDPCNEFMVNAEDVDEFPRQKEQYN